MKKRIALWMITLFLFIGNEGFASAVCSEWAADSIAVAEGCGLFTQGETGWDFREPMTRGEIVRLLLNTYKNATDKPLPKGDAAFYRDAGEEASILAVLGIMNGVGGGQFAPDSLITREQVTKIILTLQAAVKGEELTLPHVYYNPMKDFMQVSDWAKPYVEQAYNTAIVTGYEDGNFYGQKSVSKEEAVALIVRSVSLRHIVDTDQEKPVFEAEEWERGTGLCWNVKSSYEAGEITVKWNEVSGIHEYILTVDEQRNSRYEGDMPPNETKSYTFAGRGSHTFYAYPNRTYRITMSAGGQRLEQKFYIPKLHLPTMDEIASCLPQSKEEADVLMRTVTVPVWRLNANGTKTASTAELTVHSAIADRVIDVFEEIYYGEEKFPIKDLGGYAWRGGRTEHNYGTAIDLNYNENYCIYKDGTTIGDCWSPYENPYSVTPYGDVVNAFEKYGFTWGADAWSNPKDYMHFSYLGT